MPNNLIGTVEIFGAAIRQMAKPEQRHAALVFKGREDETLNLLHLGWHYKLYCEPLRAPYLCVSNSYFDRDELLLFAENALRVYEQNQGGIPYGLEYTGAAVFGGDHKFLETPGAGLTCATFILGFFKNLGFDLLDLDSWESREDDARWQGDIYGDLETNLSEERASYQKSLIGTAFRFRPEEVVGSLGIFEDVPVVFPDAVEVSSRLLGEMTTR